MAEIQNDKVLEVKNLRISFRTNTGTVKAVRGIDFSLKRGKTLAIVGESGSGKSVTSKAILGILANNKIVEDGQIIYDGKDLLKISEEQFTKIRGVKISMIFQDPLSSLNPIMKVGKQLTEAMFLKAKATRKEASNNLKRISKGFARYCDKEDYEKFVKKTEELSKSISPKSEERETELKQLIERLSEFRPIFLQGISGASDHQKKEIVSTLELIDQLKKTTLNSYESFDPKKASLEAKKIRQALERCSFALKTEADDVTEVFFTSFMFYLNSYENSFRQTKIRAELLDKHHVSSVYDLPADIRVGQREVIVDTETQYRHIVDLVEQLEGHLKAILDHSDQTAESFCDELMKYYAENMIAEKKVLTKEETKKRAIKLMEEVGINEPERRFYQYPFEFSGGMRQRIVIAIALSSNPEVLICDEPTTALDVTIQAQILELINKLKEEKNLSIIFITHDLGVVANMADDIAVMYAGKIVEYGSVYDIFYDPRHPYTWALLSSMPDLQTEEKLDAIPGTPPNMLLPPKGDAFAARNKYALEIDYEEQPPFYSVSPTHYAATWLCDDDAPDVDAPVIVRERIANSLKNSEENRPVYSLKKNSILEKIGGGK